MKHQPIDNMRFFFATAPLPCPYLPGRVERRVVAELVGRNAATLHDSLSHAGFRRSHRIVYAPACPGCNACIAVRVIVDEFQRSASQRRVWNGNLDIRAAESPATATEEQYALFAAYQNSRHAQGDMAKMDVLDYQALVEDTVVDTFVAEFRDADRRLVAACLADRLKDGLSAVYSYFDPALARHSLGTYMILWLIERARELGLAYVYLGYWIEDCKKMSYKAKFRPVEAVGPDGWFRMPEPAES